MDIEKMVNSKVYTFFDWVWRLFVLNVLTIITSLGVITAFSSIVSCFQTIKDYKEGTDEGIFKVYFRNFIYYIKRTLGMGIIIIVISGILIFGLFFYTNWLNGIVELGPDAYTESQLIFPTIGKYVLFFLVFLFWLIVNQLPIVYSYFNFRFFDNFKFALYMAIKFLVQSILEVLVWGLSVVMFIFINPVWFFLGLSLPLFLIYSISRPVYWYLANSKDVVIHDKNNVEEKEG